MKFSETLPDALDAQRLDRVVSMVAGCSRSAAAEWITDGLVLVDDAVVTTRSHRVQGGSRIEVDSPAEVDTTPRGDASVEIPVVYEDADVIVVDKPAGLVVHPGAGNDDETMVNGLLARYPELASVGDPMRPGIVHRLDRGTSGLLVVARTQEAYDGLVAALSARSVERRYDALVHGHCESERGLIDAPIGRSSREATRMAVSAQGREARTHYEVVERFDEPAAFTRLTCRLETGRTHQIRVHLAAIGLPVVADTHYGGSRTHVRLDRPFLHAAHLGFAHPTTGDQLDFDSPLPDDLVAVLATLSKFVPED